MRHGCPRTKHLRTSPRGLGSGLGSSRHFLSSPEAPDSRFRAHNGLELEGSFVCPGTAFSGPVHLFRFSQCECLASNPTLGLSWLVRAIPEVEVGPRALESREELSSSQVVRVDLFFLFSGEVPSLRDRGIDVPSASVWKGISTGWTILVSSAETTVDMSRMLGTPLSQGS